MTAKNVKIITESGVVTLRGPVMSKAEKTKIVELARTHAGTAKIAAVPASAAEGVPPQMRVVDSGW